MPDAYWEAALETMPREQLLRWQQEHLRQHLAYVYERSPYYRRAFEAAGITPAEITNLEAFAAAVPCLTKMQIIEDQREHPPFGRLLAVEPTELIRIYWSPGPELIVFTPHDYASVVDLAAKAFYTCGVRPQDVVNVTCTYHWVIAGTVIDEAFRKIGCAVIPGGAGQSRMHIEVMRATRTTVLFAFFTFAEELGHVAREMGLDPARDLTLRLAIVTGELRARTLRQDLERTFGFRTREIYGTSEVPFVAAECPEGGGMHLDPRFIVEVLDPQTQQPVAEGESGELVITDLLKRAQPSIRYRTGDITEGLDPTPCPCGRTTPKMRPILGRVGQIPRVKGLFIVPREVEEVIRRYPQLGRFQLIVDRPEIRDRLTIKIELKSPSEETSLRETLLRDLKEKIRVTADELVFVPEGSLPADAPLVEDLRRV
ncbi:Phenylacetate-coenzyme A ligase [bacterium HR10]|nr:Phenylacetate-coenzyme A ligase [bacterium HR10]